MSNQRPPGTGEPLRPKKKKRSRRWLGYTLLVFLGMALGAVALAGNFVYRAAQTLPPIEDFDPNLTSFVYDSKGEVVFKLAADENRTLIKDLNDVPAEVRQAFIDTEDHRFKEHKGVDFYRMVGAVVSTTKYFLGMEGSQLEGFSTITMQLAGNAFLDRQDLRPMRKMQEMLLAFELEKRYTKDEILLRYLNQVNFGYQAAGLEEAARTYFSKSATELTVSEAALFAGMLKGPSLYNPFTNMEGAMNRRAIVLDLMVLHGHMDTARAEELKATPVELKKAEITPTTITYNGDWYVDYVIEILTNPAVSAKYGTPLFEDQDLYNKGLKIYTALDPDWQKIAQEKIQTMMPVAAAEYGKDWEVPEAAVVVMDHRDGYVKALVGGMEHETMRGYNRATQALRQPGSAIKPIVNYLPAIDLLGWGPATVVDDSPPMLSYPDQDHVWPENYEFRYNGLISLRGALEQSINAVAVRTLQAVTPRKGIEYARNLGLSTIVDASMDPANNDENLSLALGGIKHGVTPLDLTAAYGVLGNLGMRVSPVIITRIEDKHGVTVFEAAKQMKPVVRKESAWLMVDIMKGSITRGTAAYEAKGFNGWPAAGKTGTTENWHDAWFVGFTPEIVTGVWTGYDNNKGEQKRLPNGNGRGAWTGAGPPTRIWRAIMLELVKEKPADWQRPEGLVKVDVCSISGMLPSPLCPPNGIVSDWFRRGYEPRQVDNILTMTKVVQQEWENPKTKEKLNRYYLWEEGCEGTPEDLPLLKKPNTWAKDPKDPWNIARYWPADWWKEVPEEKCPIKVDPNKPKPGDPPVLPPGDGTTPPGDGTQPPGNGTNPPPGNGTNPPGGGILPPVLPPIIPGR